MTFGYKSLRIFGPKICNKFGIGRTICPDLLGYNSQEEKYRCDSPAV